jgi:Tfp pilus assembly protein PilO
MNLLTIIFLLAVSVGSFFFYTNPSYKDVEGLKRTVASYEIALERAREAMKIKEVLQERYNTFSNEDFNHLQKMLPDTVDNIRLLLDINQVASSYGTSIGGIRVESDQSTNQNTDTKPYGGITIRFRVSMTYDNFQKFLRDIEQNLRITDVSALTFASVEGGIYTYDVTLRTYWLR